MKYDNVNYISNLGVFADSGSGACRGLCDSFNFGGTTTGGLKVQCSGDFKV